MRVLCVSCWSKFTGVFEQRTIPDSPRLLEDRVATWQMPPAARA
jgi:hypothetical protein